jgi:SAM-dependent methyltransferase
MNEMHEANRHHWDASAQHWRELRERDGLWRQCPAHPALAFEGGAFEEIERWLGSLEGKSACVIGSGDNLAAFALAGCGAHVTSVDISEQQLAVAKERAAQLHLDVTFVRADAADMAAIGSEHFDLVCSTNGFYVWIAQPLRVFSEVHRLLRPGGFYVWYDIHPFLRPWKDQVTPLELRKPYWDTGPYEEDDSFEFTWTLADLLNPLADSGLVLKRLLESPARDSRFWQGHSYEPGTDRQLLDWQHNPRAGLPQWLTVVAQRPE